jgi:hypothetical protein
VFVFDVFKESWNEVQGALEQNLDLHGDLEIPYAPKFHQRSGGWRACNR